jgi:predicted SAM-dependent methyltransferase
MDKLTLNVGCGERVFKEYPAGHKCINFDERKLPQVDEVGDVRDLPFPDEHFDYILASDIIEHFPIAQTADVLKEWRRVLKVGGLIEIRTPNMSWALEHYAKNKDAKFVSYHIFGGQDYSGNFHYVMFDKKWFTNISNSLNFNVYSYEEIGSNFIIKLRKL